MVITKVNAISVAKVAGVLYARTVQEAYAVWHDAHAGVERLGGLDPEDEREADLPAASWRRIRTR
jgi:hypothetical protein